MTPTPSSKEFIRTLFSSWLTAMSGPLSVPLAVAAYYVSNDTAKAALGFTAFFCVFFAAFRLWKQERLARVQAEKRLNANQVEILFEEIEPYVRDIPALHESRGERYFVGLRNAGAATLEGVTLRAREGWFIENSIAVAHQRIDRSTERNPVVAVLPHLDPGATELVELFGLDYNAGSSSPEDVFNQKQHFQLELRARNTPTIIADFDYDRDRRPMIHLISTSKAATSDSKDGWSVAIPIN
jgi:hypothetical protein